MDLGVASEILAAKVKSAIHNVHHWLAKLDMDFWETGRNLKKKKKMDDGGNENLIYFGEGGHGC